MATGRGQFLLNLKLGLERAQPGRHGGTARGTKKKKSANGGSRRYKGESRKPIPLPPTSGVPCPPLFYRSCSTSRNTSVLQKNYFERLPPEIILKIFTYLDAASLFSVGFVNRQFHELANDNAIWHDLYTYKTAKDKWSLSLVRLRDLDLPAQFWKKLLFSEMGCHKNMYWKKELRHINPYTGVPEDTKRVIRSLCLSWEITLTLTNGRQCVYKQDQVFFSDSAVTVCWNMGEWPHICRILTLQLHGVIRPSVDMPVDRPHWRSLISKMEVCTAKWKFFGTDSLVKLLQFGEGITVGLWRGTCTVAFIMATLHFHQLVERSLLGTVFCPYRTAEISPLYNDVTMHCKHQDYTVLMLLHNSVSRIMHCRYSKVLCKRDEVQHDYMWFHPVNIYNMSPWPKHNPASPKISFPWKAKGLQGDIKNCCMMTVSVLDVEMRPVWCISSPAALRLTQSHVPPEYYDGEQFVMSYNDADGKVRITLAWMQDLQLYSLIGLNIWVRLSRVNAHFRQSCGDDV